MLDWKRDTRTRLSEIGEIIIQMLNPEGVNFQKIQKFGLIFLEIIQPRLENRRLRIKRPKQSNEYFYGRSQGTS
jgi:hypothetical protein